MHDCVLLIQHQMITINMQHTIKQQCVLDYAHSTHVQAVQIEIHVWLYHNKPCISHHLVVSK